MPRPRRTPPPARLALALAALLLAAGCDRIGAAGGEAAPLAGAAIGGEFALSDPAGRTVRFSDFRGRYPILYFGYTWCPDVCPLDLQRLMQGYRQFAKKDPARARTVQPVFVSVDPERDSPKVVGEYISNFGQPLIGLTGDAQKIEAVKKAFAVYALRREGSAPDAYLMDHSRVAVLMDKDGKPLALLPVEQSAEAVAAELDKWVR